MSFYLMKHVFLPALASLFSAVSMAQSVAINTDGSIANSAALLDVKSTTKGMLIPRMSKAQRNAVATPANGLLVYVNAPDTVGFSFYNGTVWKWLEEKNSNSWNLGGNAGTDPTVNFIGTTDDVPLAFRINNFERMRLTGNALLGIGNQSPVYPLDINTGQSGIYPCTNTGIRVKSVAGTPACNFGLLLGYDDPTGSGNDAILWNYGQFNNTPKTISMGLDAGLVMLRLTSNGTAGIGTGTNTPRYALDLGVGITGINSCTRNGLRILSAGEPTNDCERGIFMGFDDLSNTGILSLWNFAPINNPAQNYMRFGFGTDFSASPGIGESMRIYPPGQGIGINQVNPQAMVHISNYTGGGAMPGVMVTSPILPPGSLGFYSGLRYIANNQNTGYIWNFQDAALKFGTNDQERMQVSKDGNVGINTTGPLAKLHVADSSVLFSATGFPPFPYAPAPIQGEGRRMLWYADKAAFRAGYVDGVQWNTDSIGVYSFAVGLNTKAKDYSMALGTDTKSSNGSLAAGGYTTASGLYSFATGLIATASGDQSFSAGFTTRAIGNYSIAGGYNTSAFNSYSVALGNRNTVSGLASFAMGNEVHVYGSQSAAFGKYLNLTSANSFAIGSFNDITDNPDPQNPAATDRLLQVGNGADVFTRSNALTILRNGNTGIGTVNPNALLQFSNSIANRKLVLYEGANNDNQYYGLGINGSVLRYQIDDLSSNHVFYAAVSSSASNELFRIKGNGDIGIGAPVPSAYGHGGTNKIMELKNTAAAGANIQSHLILSTTANSGSLGGVTWASTSLSGEQRTGFIGNVFESASQTKLSFYTRSSAGAINERFYIQGNGNAWLAGTLTQASDARLKTNIHQITSPLKKLQQLNGYTYNWKNMQQDNDTQMGVLAQEVQKVYPDLVKTNADGDLSVNYSGLIPVLIEAVKEQQKQIDEQRKIIELLLKK